MSTAPVDAALEYPSADQSWEEIIESDRAMRRRQDDTRWSIGWRAMQIKAAHGAKRVDEYAKAVGYARSTVENYLWTASRFSPEIVNRFPGLPWGIWKAATRLAHDDIEAALDLIEKAYDTPDLSVDAFAAMIAEEAPARVRPFKSVGRVGIGKTKSGKVIIGVELTHEAEQWLEELKNWPLFGQEAKLVLAAPHAV